MRVTAPNRSTNLRDSLQRPSELGKRIGRPLCAYPSPSSERGGPQGLGGRQLTNTVPAERPNRAVLRRSLAGDYLSVMTSDEKNSPATPEVFIVLDAVDVEGVAAFWAEALRYRRVDRLEQYVVLVPMEGASGSVFLVQGVPDRKQTKNRMHVDLHVDDPNTEVQRLVGLGATRLGEGSLGEIAWITMADPEGNEFDIGQR